MPKKHHSLFPIPSRQSSKADKQATAERAEEVVDETSSRRGSKTGILKGRRERSRASSRRSRRAQDVANMDKPQEMTDSSTPEMHGPPKAQQKKSSKLFCFLGCCGSSELDNEDVQPAKRTTMRPPASNRLPTPDKAEAHAGESCTAESRDPAFFNEEKGHLTARTGQPFRVEEEYNQAAAGAQREDLPPPAGPKDHEGAVGAANGLIVVSQMDGVHEVEEKPAVKEKLTGIDSTPENPMGSERETRVREGVVAQTTTVLPPPPSPPPLPATPAAPEVSSEPEVEAEEQTKSLLPPALPHLQNRKCLVLDLDETLVHSSFKVSQNQTR